MVDEATYTILVVEDEKPLIVAIKTKLEKNGFDVVTARTAEQAWNHLDEGVEVDALWLDHYLLGKDTGLDLLVRLKNAAKWKALPIFVVSNTASPDKRQAYIEFGVDKYFVKAENRLDEIVSNIKKRLKEGSSH
jgi:DNA-binding response OmpR family regulator